MAEEEQEGQDQVAAAAAEGEGETSSFLSPMVSPFFQGSVVEAIAKAKLGLILLVTVQDDEQSEECKRMNEETWRDEELCKEIGRLAVALRLQWNSDDGKNFLSIYPAFQLPTVYFIAPNGAPLSALTGYQDSAKVLSTLQECQQKLEAAQQEQRQPTEAPTVPVDASTQPTSASSSASSDSSENNNPRQEEEEESEIASSQQQLTLEEQKARALQKIQEIKLRKQKEEEEREKERERQRRESGKAMQDALRKQEELKLKREIEQRKKEKQEEKLARQRIKEKIERDRKERAAKRAALSGVESTSPTADMASSPPSSSSSSLSHTPSPPQQRHDHTLIVFRLLDGQTVKQQFNGNDTLQNCRQFVMNSYAYPADVGFLTNFPRHIYEGDECNMTLQQLNLVPTATLILRPGLGMVPTASPSSTRSIAQQSSHQQPQQQQEGGGVFSSAFSYVSSFLFGGSGSSNVDPSVPSSSSSSSSGQSMRNNNDTAPRRNDAAAAVRRRAGTSEYEE